MPDDRSCPRCRLALPPDGTPADHRRCPQCGHPFPGLGSAPTILAQAVDPGTGAMEAGSVEAEDARPSPVTRQTASVRSTNLPDETAWIHDPRLGSSRYEDRYAVEDEIGRGGMGMILKVADRDLRRTVAMKVMLGTIDEQKLARFREEAQVTGQLEHPNIVPVHELSLDQHGRPFFTMKLVKGRNLHRVLQTADQEGHVPTLGSLLHVFLGVCHAVAFAHSRNVLHRDLKPSNIMLGDYGEAIVMDWGLAKIINSDDGQAAHPHPPPPRPTEPMPGTEAHGAEAIRSSRKESNSEPTHDGLVIGTPAYMPPEQARGAISQLDRRSDIYSLGALLYEILTHLPPVDGKTTPLQLIQVTNGYIMPPDCRTPGRQIPKELSAITMRAMALRPEDRYQTVEALRSDIERYIEGRAVSAKQDSSVETLIKWMKRNRGTSVAMTLALLAFIVVVGGFARGLARERDLAIVARTAAERALAERDREQKARHALEQLAAPKYLGDALQFIENRQFSQALEQARLAATLDPELLAARTLAAEILLVERDWDGAEMELRAITGPARDDQDVRRLLELCRRGREDGDADITDPLIRILQDHHQYLLADRMDQTSEKRLLLLRHQIDQRLPGAAAHLSMDKDGKLAFLGMRNLNDLTFLKGVPLSRLEATDGNIASLVPLLGMPLEQVALRRNRLVDLGPLRGMPLRHLDLSGNDGVEDLAPLKGLPLTHLHLQGLVKIASLAPLRGMPLETLAANQLKITDLTPLMGMPLRDLSLYDCTAIGDFTPLKGLPLNRLNISFTRCCDLLLVQGMPLGELVARGCMIMDLGPLRGLPLTLLDLKRTTVTDLRPLQGMPLTTLILTSTAVKDFSPLAAMPLRSCILDNTAFTDLGLLTGMPLEKLDLSGCLGVRDLSPLRHVPLTRLYCEGSSVTDLTPLAGMMLDQFRFTPADIATGLETIRAMTSLREIGIDRSDGKNWPRAEFWRRYDAGEFR